MMNKSVCRGAQILQTITLTVFALSPLSAQLDAAVFILREELGTVTELHQVQPFD